MKAYSTQARLWACGRGDVSTPSFGSHPNPISTRGGQIMPTLYWCPHQVLKATGAPDKGFLMLMYCSVFDIFFNYVVIRVNTRYFTLKKRTEN